jgi:3-(3-hydroxy-phenyl)propionate hydroxylase
MREMRETGFDYDVAIVGYGPTGVIAANFLGKYGVKTLVIERDHDVYARARAVTVDGTTMRTFQALGLADEAKADMNINTALRWKTYDGFEFLRMKPRPDDWGHAGSYMIFQPQLEATLRRGVDQYPSVHVRFGEEFASLEQNIDGVAVSTNVSTYRVKYVIAADGGSSTVRKQLGVSMEGTTSERVWIVVDGKVTKSWPERELLTFWSDPIRPAVDIPLAMGFHRWEIPLGPKERKEDFASNDAIWKILKPMGVTAENVANLSYAFYSHHVRMASDWKTGRVLLAGDAAHLMPPWAGQGMQSGMRDAANLAWKLRAVLQHDVSDSILDTYQSERQPHVAKVTQSSINMGKLVETKAGVGRTVRNRILHVVSRTPKLSKKLGAKLRVGPEISGGFLSDRITEMSPIGKMLPQPFVRSTLGERILLDDALGTDFVVLGMDVDPTLVLTPEQKAGWDQYGARYEIVRSHSIPGSDSLVDIDGQLKKWFDTHGSTVVVVRPDRFVAGSDNSNLNVPLFESSASPSLAEPDQHTQVGNLLAK